MGVDPTRLFAGFRWSGAVMVLTYASLICVVASLQVVGSHRLAIGNTAPDLMLLMVCLVGLWRGQAEAVVVGLLAGFLQDVLSGGTLWVNLAVKPLIGMIAGMLARPIISMPAWILPLLLAGLSLLSGLIVLLLFLVTREDVDVVQIVLRTVVLQSTLDGLVGAVVVFFILYVFPPQGRRIWNP